MYKYFVLHTDNNRNKGYDLGYTNELPAQDCDYKELVEYCGVTYSKETPLKVVQILNTARIAFHGGINPYRLRLDYGDTKTGRSWGEIYDIEGYIGNSGGKVKIPILLYNRRSLGGAGIIDDCIIKIELAKGKKVLYQHPNYHK